MKVCVVYPEIGQAPNPFGWVAAGEQVAIALELGCKAQLGHLREHWPAEYFAEWLQRFAPDLVVFHLLPWQVEALSRYPRLSKKVCPKTPVVVCGGLATLHSETVALEQAIDILLLGEWQAAFKELLARMMRGVSTDDTPNCWRRAPGGFVKNSLKALIENADMTPMADLSLFDRLAATGVFGSSYPVRAALGTPYESALSPLTAMAKLYRGRGRFHRPHAPQTLARYLEGQRESWRFGRVCFVDELFPNDLDWLSAFVPLFRDRVGCPFEITSCVEDLGQLMYTNLIKAANCDLIWFDLGAGSQALRKEIANRNLSNKDLETVIEDVRGRGIRVGLKLNIGLPGETQDNLRQTRELIERIKPEELRAEIWRPIPGTAMYERARAEGLIERRSRAPLLATISADETVSLKQVSRDEVRFLYTKLYRSILLGRLAAWPEDPREGCLCPIRNFEASEHRLVDPAQVDLAEAAVGERRLTAFIQTPPATSEFPLEIGEETWLRFSVAVLPEAWASPAKMLVKVRAEVAADGKKHNVFERVLDPYDNPHDRQWLDVGLDLSPFHFGKARLALSVSPAADKLPPTSLRVAWGDVRLTGPQDVVARNAQETTGGESDSGSTGMQSLAALRQRIEDLEIDNKQLSEEISIKSRRAGEMAVRVNELENAAQEKDREMVRLKAIVEQPATPKPEKPGKRLLGLFGVKKDE